VTYDPHGPEIVGDYSTARTPLDVMAICSSLPPRRPLSWSEGVRVLKHKAAPALDRNPGLAAVAEAKNRLPEVLDALAALEGRT